MSDAYELKASGRDVTIRVHGEVLSIEPPQKSLSEIRLDEITAVAFKPYQPLAPRSPDGRFRIRFSSRDTTSGSATGRELTVSYASHDGNKEFRALNRWLLAWLNERGIVPVAGPKARKTRRESLTPAASEVQLRCACGAKSKTRLRSKPTLEIACTKCQAVLLPYGTRMVNCSQQAECSGCPGIIQIGKPMVLLNGKTWHVSCVPNLWIPELRDGQKRTGSRRNRSVRTVSGGLPTLGRSRR